MARCRTLPQTTAEQHLTIHYRACVACGKQLLVAHHTHRTIRRLDGVWRLTLTLRHCRNVECQRYRRLCRPEDEGGWALPHGEFGFDIIALVGHLRYTLHRSVPEIHGELQVRGVEVAERTITNLLTRYEELVTVHLTDNQMVRERFLAQGHVILGLDGLKPDVGHEVLWVLRDCISGEVILARSLLSECEEEVGDLLREVKEMLPVPITGVISDGQRSIRCAVEQALPNVPHQLCQYHYLREAAKPIYEADRHAKTVLKARVRGIRAIERSLECTVQAAKGVLTSRKLGTLTLLSCGEIAILQGYCQAIRSALTDDGQPPLCAAGLRLHERLSTLLASLERCLLHEDLSWSMRFALGRLRDALFHGLEATASLWTTIRESYTWVFEALHILANADRCSSDEVQQRYQHHVAEIGQMVAHLPETADQRIWYLIFAKVTASYGERIFRCYDHPELPCTNNDLEQLFGSVRYHERRASGRKQVAHSLLVRGAIRIFATVGASPSATDLRPKNLERWREVRREVEQRRATRCAGRRFRKHPQAYVEQLECVLAQLLQSRQHP